MVTASEPSVELERPQRSAFGLPAADLAEHLSLAVLAVTWILYVIPSSGGFHDPKVAAGLAAAVPAVLVTKPWKHLPRTAIGLVTLMAFGGLVTLSVAPTGWSQADSLADHVAGGVALLAVAGYARTSGRRLAVVVVLLLALLVQFWQAWLPWWGSSDPNHLMVGTFYWHNQLAVYMAALGLLAVVLAMLDSTPVQRAAMVGAPLAAAAVVFSTSRTTLGLLVLGWLSAGLLLWRAQRRGLALSRWLLLPLLTVAAVLALTSSVFFDRPYSGLAATQQRTDVTSPAGERGLSSLGNNGGDRIAWSRASLDAWTDEPLVGNGFDSFLYTSATRLSAGATTSRFVHNGYAEALGSGGILFGGPVMLGTLLLLWLCLRGGIRAIRKDVVERPVLAGSCLAAGVLLAHAAVDFDWHYAGLAVLLGVVGGVAVAVQLRPRTASSLPALPTAIALVAAIAIGATASLVEHRGRTGIGAVHAAPPAEVERLLDAGLPGAYDPRYGVRALERSIAKTGRADRLAVPASLAERVLDETSRIAELDQGTAMSRAELEALLGRAPAALRFARDLLARQTRGELWHHPTYLQIADAAGVYEGTRREVSREVLARLKEESVEAEQAWPVVIAMARLDGPTSSRETACLFGATRAALGKVPLVLKDTTVPMGCPT